MTRTLLFFGSEDAISEGVVRGFSEQGFVVRQVTGREVDFLDPAQLEHVLGAESPEVVVVYPSWRGHGSFLESTTTEWESSLAQNVEAVTYSLQAAAQQLEYLNKGGRIIVLSHVASLEPFQGLSILGTTLAAVKVLVKMLALELAPHNITVNAVAMGPGLEGLSQTAQDRLAADTPFGAETRASLVNLCLFLASEGARHITGQTLNVDGGFLLTRGAGVSPYAE